MAALALLLAASAARAQTTFTVNSAADPGTMGCDATECTLREAITAANATAGADAIEFAISGAGPHTIAVGAPLPGITEALTVDGNTQPGSAANTNSLGGLDTVIMIELTRSASLGTGVGLDIISDDVTIRGLSVGGFGNGIVVNDGFQNVTIAGNFVGTDAAGTGVAANATSGVFVGGGVQNVTIGGSQPADRNLISGNTTNPSTAGLRIAGGAATPSSVTVAGNLIGTDVSGVGALPNAIGIRLPVAGSGVSDAIVIGGPLPEDGNVISGNASHGVNVIKSGAISDPFGNQNRMEGNLIGVAADGVGALGNNGNGIWFSNTASRSHWVVTGNVIAFNLLAGVQVNAQPSTGVGEAITRNSIFGNTGLGIDVDAVGVNANDLDDGDLGGNDRQNFPVLSEAIADGSALGVFGLLNSVPGGTYLVEIFDNEPTDTPGTEGRTFLADTVVMTGAAGTSTPFSVVIPTAVDPGRLITATATNDQGNTSEFSAAVVVQVTTTSTIPSSTTTTTTTPTTSSTSTSTPPTTTSTSTTTSSTAPTTTSSTSTTSTTIALCGNGTIDPGEECDTNDFGGATCPGSSVVGAFLTCNPDCTIDFSGCPGSTTTSTSVPPSTSSTSTTVPPSTTTTTSTSTTTTTSSTLASTTSSTSSTTSTTIALCGNGMIDPGEECDTNDFGGATCPGSSVVGAFLTCNPDCTIDFSGCPGSTTTSTSVPPSTSSTSTTVPPSTTSTTATSTSTSTSSSSSSTTSSSSSTTPTTSSTSTTTVSSTTTTSTSSTTSTTIQVGLVPGGKAVESDCYLELAVVGVANDGTQVQDDKIVVCTDGTACDTDGLCDNLCTFRVAACVNQTDPNVAECTPPASLDSASVKGKVTVPLPPLDGSTCGAFVDVAVEAKFNKKGAYQAKKSRLKLKGKARAPKGTKPRTDVDGWKFQCLPNDACN